MSIRVRGPGGVEEPMGLQLLLIATSLGEHKIVLLLVKINAILRGVALGHMTGGAHRRRIVCRLGDRWTKGAR